MPSFKQSSEFRKSSSFEPVTYLFQKWLFILKRLNTYAPGQARVPTNRGNAQTDNPKPKRNF